MAAMVHEGANWASKLGALDVLLWGNFHAADSKIKKTSITQRIQEE